MNKICVINPNTSSDMTKLIEKTSTNFSHKNLSIKTIGSDFGPESIEGYYDEIFSVPGLIQKVKDNLDSDAFIIACFDDTGLDAVRSITEKPVIGIGEASFHVANLISNSFGIITTLSRSIPALKNNLDKYGFSKKCTYLSAVEIPVLDIDKNQDFCVEEISKNILQSKKKLGIEAVVLGCAGMGFLLSKIEKKCGIPIIEGISSSVVLAEAMIKLGVKTSKFGGYAYPRSKNYSGIFKNFSP